MTDEDEGDEFIARASRLAAAGAIGASVAHELRNALVVAETSLFLARRDIAERTKLERHLDQVTLEIQRAQRVVTAVLALARGEGITLERSRVAGVIEGARRAVVLPKNVTFAVSIAPPELHVRCDAVLLERVLANLYLNAVQAIGRRRQGAISTSVEGRSDEVLVQVDDDGPGVDPALAASIFDPLFTTRSDGLGVGLALCRAVVEAHGSRLILERAPSGGARFWFTLPS